MGEDIPALERRSDGVDVLARTGEPHPETGQRDVLFVAVGAMARVALEASKVLAAEGIQSTVVDPRWVMPVPSSVVELARDHRIVVTIEDGVSSGGVHSACLSRADSGGGWPDRRNHYRGFACAAGWR